MRLAVTLSVFFLFLCSACAQTLTGSYVKHDYCVKGSSGCITSNCGNTPPNYGFCIADRYRTVQHRVWESINHQTTQMLPRYLRMSRRLCHSDDLCSRPYSSRQWYKIVLWFNTAEAVNFKLTFLTCLTG